MQDESREIGVVLVGRDGRIRAVDEIARGLLTAPGTSSEALEGRPLLDLVQGGECEALLAIACEASLGPEVVALCRADTTRSLRLRASRASDDGFAVRVEALAPEQADALRARAEARMREALPRRDVEGAYQRNREFLSTLVQASPLGIAFIDADAIVRTWNPAAERILGWSATEAIGAPRGKAFGKTLEGSLPADETGQIEHRLARKDGRQVVVELTATPVRSDDGAFRGTIAVFSDVTVRVLAGESVRRSEANFRTLVANAPVGVAAQRDGRILFANAWLEGYLGYGTGELHGRPLEDIVDPVELEAVRARASQILEGENVVPARECRFRRRDGSAAIAEVSGAPWSFEGKPAVVVIVRDVGERQRLVANMMAMDRMIAVGTLAAGVAHEINNPLAYLLANLDFVDGELGRGVDAAAPSASASDERAVALEDVRAALADARDGARRVRDIVRDLKTFSRQESDLRQPVELDAVLESALSMAQNEIRHRAVLVRDFRATPRVVANESRLCQVFLNLMLNAAQAIPEGRAAANRIVVRTFTHGDRAVVEVEDSGEGIPAEILPRIFDPFFTTKPVGQGTGLGLSICRGIVTGLDGTIGVESKPGQGTVFRVELPASAEDARSAPAEDDAAKLPLRGRILVIDDELLVVVAIRRALGPGVQVVHAIGGRDALARLEQDSAFDLVLCDLMMPDLDGVDVFEQLRVKLPALAERTVFLTGGAFTPRAESFLQRDGLTVVEKPFDPQSLRALIRARSGTNATA